MVSELDVPSVAQCDEVDMDIPKQMQHLKVWNGFPITFVTTVVNGVPDFRTISLERMLRCKKNRLCSICGHKIDGWVAFIGGEEAVKERLFLDPHMHKECAYYAAKVCPFLAGTKRQYAKTPGRGEGDVVVRIVQERPKRMAIYLAKSFEIVEQGQTMYRPCRRPRFLDWDVMPRSE